MRIKNDKNHFGVVSILFHWTMALLVIGLLIVGLYMASLPINPDTLQLYAMHKSTGILVLMLISLRFIWKLNNTTPSLHYLPKLELILSRLVHWSFYILLFTMPIVGWLMSSAGAHPVSFFNLFTLPNLIEPNKELSHLFASIHKYIGYTLIGLIILHVSGALKHHFYNKDNTLKRMLQSK